MLILSQDKSMIINFDRIINIYVEKNKINYQCPDIEDFWGTIGKYETEERAKEVLKEIAYFYSRADYNTKPVSFEQGLIAILSRHYGMFVMPEK